MSHLRLHGLLLRQSVRLSPWLPIPLLVGHETVHLVFPCTFNSPIRPALLRRAPAARRLFALAAILQIVISFPIMFVIVDVVLQQRPFSAFATTSLWVVTGAPHSVPIPFRALGPALIVRPD